MTPIPFPEANVVLGKDQTEYLPLPAHRSPNGVVVSCWRLGWWARVKALVTGRVWVMQHTFGMPLQPQCLTADRPFATARVPDAV